MKSPQYSRFGTLAQLDGLQKYGDNPRSPTTPTIEHLMGVEASRWSPHSSPTLRRDHDPEEDHTPNKKSVLTKVKEKARKLRHSLSGKKKHYEEDNTTPSWGVTLEDDEDEEEDAEYLGAPMYESELAPEGYREHARQHPRAIPVISDKHVLASSVNSGAGQENENPPTPNKTLTETVTEKLSPAYATVSDATQAIASKIQDLTVSSLADPGTDKHENLDANKQANLPTVKLSTPETDKRTSPTGQVTDKGVSVKEYIKNKLEPGEDDKALSKVITDTMSPRKSPREVGVMDKMKEAVTAFLWNEEPSQSSMTQSPKNASTSIPVSTNAHEVAVDEEKSHGKVLQPN
ncbi:Low-temperature-induced protein [Melia azedarach]|uniref:Low-temperature-induced protein n=1 Tax=Melia azedarach TaxID=155640 RepID=A0ACC1YQM3_MELAZ|nr:Low-temperature-induced protein [Melia azedarach]